MNGMTTDIYFDLKGNDNDANTNEITNKDFRSLCKIHSDNLFLLQMHFQETKNRQVSQMNGTPPYEAPFWGNPCAGLASMNLG